ncbi:SpvB/TcaC N-terminal domain-containing protein, partial [Riemerella columbina]|uniref:SpvB/TcaC N-terminal domain-containing protein n=1 Tax=Riemerella columbina TaxID=103810 RepID=UPI00036F90EC
MMRTQKKYLVYILLLGVISFVTAASIPQWQWWQSLKSAMGWRIATKEVPIASNHKGETTIKEHTDQATAILSPTMATTLSYKGFSGYFPAGSVVRSIGVRVVALKASRLPEVPNDIVNLTKTTAGYRVLPQDLKLKQALVVTINYDKTKLPEGYTEKDIHIFSYNKAQAVWQKLPKDSIMLGASAVRAKTFYASDLIAGIIKLPESPDTSGYTPTTISGLKVATPLLGIQPIQMPTANAEGTATMGFSIELPKGRAGLQPSLQIQYEDEGGASWAGTGWNLVLPSLSVDTRWGAPRYDEQKETESYILSGEELLPNAHREEWKDRVADQYFYPRREGVFQSIQRLGNSPSDYHWVVKSKSGLISYYGGTENSQLSTPQGAIGYWALREQRDLRGNTIHYEYTKDGGVLYPKSIYYTGKDNSKGVYSVHFITDKDLGEPQRKDIQISARLGFKQEHNRLLRKVEVKYKNQLVRAYELIYKEGAFRKPLLQEIKTYDAEGQLFYANTIEYYDDVRDSAGKYQPFGAFKKWEVPKDNIKYTFVGINGFSGHPTLAGTSSSTSKGVSFRLGVGPSLGSYKINTIGGNGGISSGKTETQVFLQDLDGDNLPDKVYAKKGKVYYRKNLSSKGLDRFSDELKEINISNLGITENSSYSFGVDLQGYGSTIGYDRQNSTSKTLSYFMDFNGDGLVDFANGGRVYYNRLMDGVPTFYTTSSGTPAPIIASNNKLTLEGNTENTKEELEKHNPLHDVVKTWRVPHTGKILVKHTYQLQQDNSEVRLNYKKNDGTEKADGVCLYFQYRDSLYMKEDIAAEDYTIKHHTDSLEVKQGEVLYFRVSSKYDGNFDKTLWTQNIEYTEIGDEKDYNGLGLKHYNPVVDALYASEEGHIFMLSAQPKFEGLFSKGITTDLVKVKIYKTGFDIQPILLYERTFQAEEEVELDLSTINLGNFRAGEGINISVESPTEINWQKLNFSPKIRFINEENEEEVRAINVNFQLNEKLDVHYIPKLVMPKQKGKLRLSLDKTFSTPQEGNLQITAKQLGKVAARKTIHLSGISTPSEPIALDSISKDEPLFIEIKVSNKPLYKKLIDENVNVVLQIKDSIKIPENDPRYPKEKYEIITTNQLHSAYAVYTPYSEGNKNMFFGKSFRGWGGFILNGNLAGDEINEILLRDFTGPYSDNKDDVPDTDPNKRNPEQEQPGMEISNAYFIRGLVSYPQKLHRGLEEDIYVSDHYFSPSRLGENDLEKYLDTTLPQLQGAESGALVMISESRSNAFSGGAAIVGGSYATGYSKVTQTMSDFNGDRFPDFVRGGSVQFTEPRGGLDGRKIDLAGDFSRAKVETMGGSFSGSFQHGDPKSSMTFKISKNDQQKMTITRSKDDADKAKNSVSVSGSVSSAEDHSEYTYTDINGDGLADRITNEGYISYNTGYGFLPQEEWQNFGGLLSGESQDFSAGLGYSAYAGSFTGGLNYTNSKTQSHIQFLDMNGDGLADRIVYENDRTLIFQNLGKTWDSIPLVIPKVSDNPIAVNRAISYGGSAKFSVYFKWAFIKVGITAGAFAGKSTSRMEAAFMDMDGDGNLDYILSDGEDDLRVALSNIRRTNKLKSVKNATGSTFEVDYEWIAPTYENPYSRWVLKSVKTFDGHKGDGEDYTHTEFSYKKPYYDRRERTFYGFAEVEQKQLNPKDGTVLRTTVQNFYNRDYFRKSLPKNSYTLDQNGNKLTEQNTHYQIKDAKTNADIDPIALALPNTDATSVFIAPVETTERQYEGSGYLEHKTAQTYDAKGNIITYQDFGNGNANSAIKANISYYESQTPYYGGIAKSLAVYDEKGLVRKREASINTATGEVVQIRNYMEASKYATTDLAYDDYGNLSKVTGAENHKGERATLQYEYDDETHSHITKITDQFGYQNTMAYDYRFNAPLVTTDRNGSTIQYTFDAKGRTTHILAPKEAAAGVPYTIAYEYHPEAKVPYAKTRNYDAEHGADIITYTYMDGVGRTLQVKKTAALFQGKAQADAERLIVSGKQIYDALGRVIESYYPTTEIPSEAFSTQVATLAPTTTAYDPKDRPILQTLPDGSTVQTAYDIAELSGTKTLKTTVTDALGRASQSYTDVLGRTLRQVQPTGIETQYEYNALGEVLKVTDAEGHQTLSTYDLLGRRTQLTHPDAGTTTLAYDQAGNLIRRQTAQIREQMPDAAIEYQYSYNRLQEIQYPKHPENNVRYHYGKQSESPLRRGRLWLVEDASGGTEYFYGNMGEVTKEIRSIRITPTEVQTYITEYEYDTWNRIQHMTYPDGEVLDFGYNRAGQLTSLTGKKGNYEYTYLKQQGYDEFEQKVYRLYGNGTETSYTYDATMRRLANLKAQSGTYVFQNNRYTYDLVGNILQVANQVPIINYALGGASSYQYQYDELNRLTQAKGQYTGEATSAEYQLQMQYNKLNGIVQKALTHKQNGKDKGYVLDYVYGNKSHPYALSELKDSTTPKPRAYEYDGNGNPIAYQGFKDFRLMVWD